MYAINTTSVPSFQASIFVGTKNKDTGEVKSLADIEEICQRYCDEVSLCVTVTPTNFIYTNGREAGAIVGLINYPRFPTISTAMHSTAIELADILLHEMGQYRVTVIIGTETIMLSNKNTV